MAAPVPSSELLAVSGPGPVDAALARLAAVTRVLQVSSMLAVSASGVALVWSLLGLRLVRDQVLGASRWTYSLDVGSVLTAGIAMLAAILYEITRQRGDVLFDEISDELQWHMRKRKVQSEAVEYRPQLDARIVLRSFAHASELPFVPGRHGPAIVLLSNVALLTLVLVYAR